MTIRNPPLTLIMRADQFNTIAFIAYIKKKKHTKTTKQSCPCRIIIICILLKTLIFKIDLIATFILIIYWIQLLKFATIVATFLNDKHSYNLFLLCVVCCVISFQVISQTHNFWCVLLRSVHFAVAGKSSVPVRYTQINIHVLMRKMRIAMKWNKPKNTQHSEETKKKLNKKKLNKPVSFRIAKWFGTDYGMFKAETHSAVRPMRFRLFVRPAFFLVVHITVTVARLTLMKSK